MKEIINQIFAQWRVAKDLAAEECERSGHHNMAERLRQCEMFKGTEDLDGLFKLFVSPQGMEFCLRYRFPSLSTFRLLKPHGVQRYGVYIDAGAITLKNPKRAILIGRTSAVVNCDTLERHEIYVFHGASVSVNARGWSVVSVQGVQGARVIKNVSENAVIL